MFDRLTERARQVMTLARLEAQRLDHDHIGTGHVLVGLAQEGSGVAAQVLKNLDVDIRRTQAELERLLKRETGPVAGPMLPFSPDFKRVLECALEEAQDLGSKCIGTEHLLLGLIRVSDGPAAEVLRTLGVPPAVIRDLTIELLGADPPGREQEESRALVEKILLNRLRHAESVKGIVGAIELEVRSSHGLKGWGFQLWMGHRDPNGDLRTEMAFWVGRAPSLEEHFAAVLGVFVRLVRSDSASPAP